MEDSISAAEANRKFSSILREVREGHRYVVTVHGRAVARVVPANDEANVGPGARALLFDRLEKQAAGQVGRWSRDELYEDEA